MTTIQRRQRLIEVAFPLEDVSEHSRREKNIRQGHISTLHIWWARRPLAACRAFIYASLVDDPGEAPEREALLREVADLASWDAVRFPDRVVRTKGKAGSGLTGRQLLDRARRRILECNGGVPPRVLDPFAGGGAIPLEALRLGCEVEASDLNPVAVLILKATVEYPQKYGRPDGRPVPDYIRAADRDPQAGFGDGDWVHAYGQNPLATDVRYWGAWMLERARAELAPYYPRDPDGSVAAAYLWSRTVPCPNCGAEMPLVRQYWLARKDSKKVALQPLVDRERKMVDFRVVEGEEVTGTPEEATTSRGDTLCLVCQQVVKAEAVRQAAQQGKMRAILTCVVLKARDSGGKRYRSDISSDLTPFEQAAEALKRLQENHDGDLSLVPDEPVNPYDHDVNRPVLYGGTTWGDLFNARQLLALTTFARLVGEAHVQMHRLGLDTEYSKAIATYLGLAIDRLADYNATVSRWGNDDEGITNTFARQAIPMVWDYGEANPIGSAGGSWESLSSGQLKAIGQRFSDATVTTRQADARAPGTASVSAVITDPPYYDAINYADLSDFFYVWLKRSIGFLHTDLVSLPLTPKRDQIVMNVYGQADAGGDGNRREAARGRYIQGMAESFEGMSKGLTPDGLVGVVFAHTDPDAWATLIEGLLGAGLVPDASWPIDTEQQNKVAGFGQARLRTSAWMACRQRHTDAHDAYLGDVLTEMRPVIRDKLLDFWARGIRGPDFFISGIGPALSVFGRHPRVLYPDDQPVTVRQFLDIVRREATNVALEQVLHGADLGQIDPVTRSYVTWVWSYSRAPLEAGEAIALCLATGADYHALVRPHAIAAEAREKSKKLVKLRTIRERAMHDEELGQASGARATPLIDQLQWAAHLWGTNRPQDLARYRGSLGEQRWAPLRTLGQAVAECLPDGDEDRRIVLGLLGSAVMATNGNGAPPGRPRLPGF